jgi:16S rRNA C967 or C1407 C5-methylase (RsmB/RsmF family)
LVYSVCSMCPIEGEEVVKWALDNFKEMTLEYPKESLCDLEYSSYGVESILGSKDYKKVLRFDPVYNNESIGFFIAKFKKNKIE